MKRVWRSDLLLLVPILPAIGSLLTIASCKPTEKMPAPETQETNAPKVIEDFGPTLLKIATRYSISSGEGRNKLDAYHCGFVDLNGKVVLEPQWDEVSGFWDGVASVQRGVTKVGWIDKTGQLFTPPPLSSQPDIFSEGLAPFQRDGKWGYLDRKGTVVIQPDWEGAREFQGGYAEVKRGGTAGGIDKTGRLVVPLGRYEGLYFIPELGLWQITVNRKSGYMDRSGHVVIKPQWDDVVWWSEDLGLVVRAKKLGFIDKTGKVVIPVEYESANFFREGLAPVKRNGKWSFIDKTGKVVIESQWEDAYGFHKGLAAVQQNGKWGFIDRTGKVVIEPRWEEVGDLGRELILIKENKKLGFMDRAGRVVIEPQWDVADYYWETQWDMSGLDENEPVYWLVAREENPESLQDKPANWFQSRSKPAVRVLWLDSNGRQIWSSMGGNTSGSSDTSPSPQEH